MAARWSVGEGTSTRPTVTTRYVRGTGMSTATICPSHTVTYALWLLFYSYSSLLGVSMLPGEASCVKCMFWSRSTWRSCTVLCHVTGPCCTACTVCEVHMYMHNCLDTCSTATMQRSK